MKQQADIKKITIIAVSGCLFLSVLLVSLGLQRYYAYQHTFKILKEQEAREAQLKQDVDENNNLIKNIIKEEEDFKKILFEERDVPAFLDGISDSAKKALVYILEMKTQQFSQVNVPQNDLDSNQLSRTSVYGDQSQFQQRTQDAKARLNDMLTLASMPIHFKIHGTFESIVNFLSSIESYRQLLTVSNVEISSREDYPQLVCEFTLRIYSLKKFKDIKA